MESTARLRNPLMILVGAVLVISVITVFLIDSFTDDQVEITVRSSPPEVDLMVDGERMGRVASGETLEVATGSGTVELVASEQGYQGYQGTYEVDPEGENLIEFVLPPDSEEAEEQAEEQERLGYQRHMTEQYLDEAEEAYEDHPVLHELPEEQEEFRAYQGLAEQESQDFAIHLYLYEDDEERGREAFDQWMTEIGYDSEDYEVVENVEPRDDDTPDPRVEPPPTVEELEDMDLQPVNDLEISAEDLDAAELAEHFALIGATWDPAEDQIPGESMERAKELMTDQRADEVQSPENPSTTARWDEAAADEAISHPWVAGAVSEGDGVYTVDVCWAWLTEEDDEATEDDDEVATFDGPRTYEIHTTEEGGTYRVEGYRYTDPDPFVEPTGECIPDDN